MPAWATALMAARMLPTAGEVNTAPAMTPVSIPFPMKPGDGADAGWGPVPAVPRPSHAAGLHSLVNPAVCLVLKEHRGHPPQTFPRERSPWRGLPCPPSGGSHHPVPSDSLFLFPALLSLLLHLTRSGEHSLSLTCLPGYSHPGEQKLCEGRHLVFLVHCYSPRAPNSAR